MKNLFSLLMLISTLGIAAQPVIVSSSAPQAGDVWTEYDTDAVSGITLGNAGANQIWTYLAFTEEFDYGVLEFVAPSSLPSEFDGMFPNADLAMSFEEDSSAQFFNIEPDGFYLDGYASYSNDAEPPYDMLEFDPDNIILPFNFGYLDVRNHESRNVITFYSGDSGFQIRTYYFSELVGDGHGTISTPAGTFTDVLRVKISMYTVDSIFADISGGGDFEFVSSDGPSDVNTTYIHLQNAEPMLIASIDTGDDESTIEYFTYYQTGAVGIQEEQTELGLALYPNPGRDAITLIIDQAGSFDIRISDLRGTIVYLEKYYSNGSAHQLDLKNLSPGIYSVDVVSASGVTSRKLCIE